MRIGEESKTPTIGETIKTMIDASLFDVNVAMPAKIVSYDASTQYADVQPSLQRRVENGELMALPVIPNVPVVHPRANGGKAFIHMPLKSGDEVMLVFSHRSLDNWKTQGGLSDPADRRRFHLSDAVAYVGGSSEPDSFTPETTDAVEIVNDKSKMFIHPNGTYDMKGGMNDNMVLILRTLIRAIQRSYTMTLIGPQLLIDPEDPDWSLLLNRMDQFVTGPDLLPPGLP